MEKEVELGAAVHEAFQQLEAVDLPLGLLAYPGQAQAGTCSGSVLIEIGGEAFSHAYATGRGLT